MGLGDAGSADAGQGTGNAGASGGAGNSGGGQGNGDGKGAVGSAGGAPAASWRDSLPEEIRTNPAISSFQDVTAMTKSFIHAQSLVGKKGAVPPSDWSKATPEEKKGFFEALGVPSADKYEITTPAGVKIPDDVTGWFKQQAIDIGLLPHQANALLSNYAKLDMDRSAKAKTDAQQAMVEGLKGLRLEWGEAYAKNVQSAEFAAKRIGGDDFLKYLGSKPELANDPQLIKFLVASAKGLGEDVLREGGVGTGGTSPKEIEAAMDEIRANPNYSSKDQALRLPLIRKMESLGKQLTGGR